MVHSMELASGRQRPGEVAKEQPIAEDVWFRAQIRGTSIIPQREAGAALFLGLEYMNTQSAEARNRFLEARLSSEQARFAGEAASKLHVHHNIPYTTEERIGDLPPGQYSHNPIIKPERFEELWQGARNQAVTNLAQYMYLLRHDAFPRFPWSVEGRVYMEEFMTGAKWVEARERLRSILQTCCDALGSPEGRAMLESYQSAGRKLRSKFDDETMPELTKLFVAKCREAGLLQGMSEIDINTFFSTLLHV